jgi:hypothetical protein
MVLPCIPLNSTGVLASLIGGRQVVAIALAGEGSFEGVLLRKTEVQAK